MSIGRWKDKEDTVRIYNGIAVRKGNAFESVLVGWVNLQPIILREVCQKEKNKYIKTYMGFPDGSDDKESTCNARDPG